MGLRPAASHAFYYWLMDKTCVFCCAEPTYFIKAVKAMKIRNVNMWRELMLLACLGGQATRQKYNEIALMWTVVMAEN